MHLALSKVLGLGDETSCKVLIVIASRSAVMVVVNESLPLGQYNLHVTEESTSEKTCASLT